MPAETPLVSHKNHKKSELAFCCARTPLAIALYLAACLAFLLAPPRAGGTSGLATMFDKHSRLHNLPAGKIVLIGGSNVSTGVDSETIEKALHRPVVNMGLGASLGLRYMMQEVKDDIRAGDLLVVLPEYDYFLDIPRASNAHLNGSSDLFQLALAHPPSIKWIAVDYLGSPDRFYNGLADLQTFIGTKKNFYANAYKRYKDSHFSLAISDLLQPGSTIFTQRKNYNKYGDFVGHLKLQPPGFGALQFLDYPTDKFNDEAIQAISDFGAEAERKGATVVIIPPPFPLEQKALPRARVICAHWQTIRNVSVLSATDRYTFAKEEFFDTPYHMNAHGRVQRTARIVEDLRTYLANR